MTMKTITIIATAMLLLVCCETNAINAVDGMTATYDDNELDPNTVVTWDFISQARPVPIGYALKTSMPSFELIIRPQDVEDMSPAERHAFGAMIGVLQTLMFGASDEFMWQVLTEGLPQRLLEKVVVKGE